MERRCLKAISTFLIVSFVLVGASTMNISKAEGTGKLIVDTIIVTPVLEIYPDYQDLLFGEFFCKYHFEPYLGSPEGVSLHILESGHIQSICYDVVGPSPPGTPFEEYLSFSYVGNFHDLDIVHAVVTISVSFWEYADSGSTTQKILYGSDTYYDTLLVPVEKRESKVEK